MEPGLYTELIAQPTRFFGHDDAVVRRLAVASSHPLLGSADVVEAIAQLAADDPSARVRAEATEALGSVPASTDRLLGVAGDPDPLVREAVATALGEQGDRAGSPWLIEAAEHDSDRLVREAAVAALGAIGDETAVAVLLRIVSSGPPQLRRRAVVALTVFDHPDVEPALRCAAQDRNPMVREVAEMVVGRPATWERGDEPAD